MKWPTFMPLVFALLMTISCKKVQKDMPPPNNSPKTVDIYVAGTEIDAASGNRIGVYLKNGIEHKLTSAIQEGVAVVAGIYVNGSDSNVYVGGYVATKYNNSYGKNHAAVFWKNDIETDLTDGTADAEAHGISGNGDNVYMAGYKSLPQLGESYPVYWQLATGLADSLSSEGGAQAIYYSGSQLYIVGSSHTIISSRIWGAAGDNGASVSLKNTRSYADLGLSISQKLNPGIGPIIAGQELIITPQYSPTGSLLVDTNEAYPIIWFDNGNSNILPLPAGNPGLYMFGTNSAPYYSTGVYGSASGADYANSTIYVCGLYAFFDQHTNYGKTIAALWTKSSSSNSYSLTQLSDGSGNAVASAVWVTSAGDVYVVGSDNNGIAKLWKNGTSVSLPNITGLNLSSIYIVEH